MPSKIISETLKNFGIYCDYNRTDITEQKNKYYDKGNSMEKLRNEITSFIANRNWQKFHSPKNLAMALTVEAAELLEIFQWLTPEESSHPTQETLSHIEEEIGDVMIYLTTVATSFGLDPIDAAHKKLRLNEKKYPAENPPFISGKKTQPR